MFVRQSHLPRLAGCCLHQLDNGSSDSVRPERAEPVERVELTGPLAQLAIRHALDPTRASERLPARMDQQVHLWSRKGGGGGGAGAEGPVLKVRGCGSRWTLVLDESGSAAGTPPKPEPPPLPLLFVHA